ncbi:MAG: hypothetical protein J0M17_02125 [Planctomycetes bacterium]|nr:hypothetical protein [Planctomycetota bacterium]
MGTNRFLATPSHFGRLILRTCFERTTRLMAAKVIPSPEVVEMFDCAETPPAVVARPGAHPLPRPHFRGSAKRTPPHLAGRPAAPNAVKTGVSK